MRPFASFFFVSLNSHFSHEEVSTRTIRPFVVVAFSYSLCGRLLRFFIIKHVKHVIILNWHSLCGRSASFALCVIGLGRLGGFGGLLGSLGPILGLSVAHCEFVLTLRPFGFRRLPWGFWWFPWVSWLPQGLANDLQASFKSPIGSHWSPKVRPGGLKMVQGRAKVEARGSL